MAHSRHRLLQSAIAFRKTKSFEQMFCDKRQQKFLFEIDDFGLILQHK